MNTDAMFSSATDLWETPQDFFDQLDQEFHFETDVCALPENAKCQKFYTPEENGLLQEWGGIAGVIPLMADKSGSGCRKHPSRTQQRLCCFQQEPTRNGSMSTS